MERTNTAARDFAPAQLRLIRRSVARLCTDAEFDQFMAVARAVGLDPMRRQITPLISNAADPEQRQLIPWTTIDGLRVIAARQGDYRPMEDPPHVEIDAARVDRDCNPLGLVRAEVRAWKRSGVVWHAVAGEAWWDEVAPLRTHGGDSGGLVLDRAWARMGRVMLAKCAEAQALRRGWPDVLSGLYGEEELHALNTENELASERLARIDAQRAERIAGERAAKSGALWIEFDPASGLTTVPRAELFDRLSTFYASADAVAIARFLDRNREGLRIFWDWAPEQAFQLKQYVEHRLDELARAPGKSEAANTRKRKPKLRKVVTRSKAGPSPEHVSYRSGGGESRT